MIFTVNDASREEINRVLNLVQTRGVTVPTDRGRKEKSAEKNPFRITDNPLSQSITTFKAEYVIPPSEVTFSVSSNPYNYGYGSNYGNDWGG
jgi:hypothetical protein